MTLDQIIERFEEIDQLRKNKKFERATSAIELLWEDLEAMGIHPKGGYTDWLAQVKEHFATR